jgi:hypothetical protein
MMGNFGYSSCINITSAVGKEAIKQQQYGENVLIIITGVIILRKAAKKNKQSISFLSREVRLAKNKIVKTLLFPEYLH